MKKKLLFLLGAVVVVMAVMSGFAFMSVRANDTALETIRADESVIVLSVSGMT